MGEGDWAVSKPLARCASCRRSGFTLVEVCVAALVMVISFAVILGVMSSVRRSTVLVENRLSAMHIARQELEKLHRLGYFNLAAGRTQLADDRGYYDIAEVADGDGSYKNITVVIRWEDPQGDIHQVSLATSLSRSLHK